jgi:hypothetical protein
MPIIDIAGIDETIRKLQELKRMANDPALAPFIKVSANGNGAVPHAPAPAPKQQGDLGDKMLAVCRELRHFTGREVYEGLEKRSVHFEGKFGQKIVNNYLRAFVQDGVIRIESQGAGRRATRYAA